VSEIGFSSQVLSRFMESAAVELGKDRFHTVLALSKLPGEWTEPPSFQKMDAARSAQAYASLQAAIRTYYGRGARGVLLRIGQRLWHHLLAEAAFGDRAQAVVIRRLPLNARRKRVLDLLARLLSSQPGDLTLHTLDLDLLLADHVSPTTFGIQDPLPVCFVTQGLVQESLYWASGQRYDVEETSCRARGENACEFKITIAN
jgi:hypothetical protein